jgi:ABC-type glycerol-3-phosphate transport system substrate-binding protein
MKRIKKIALIAAALSILAVFGSSACDIGSGSASEINIAFWKSGLGDKFINDVADAFRAKYPQYTVKLDISSDISLYNNHINLGARYNQYDLFFTSRPKTGLDKLEPLGDVLDTVIGAESKSIRGKYAPEVLEPLEKDNYLYLPYSQIWTGLVYNADIINGVKYKTPNTTDELIALTTQLKNDNITPFIHFQVQGYWGYFYQVWQAQHDGLAYYKDHFLMLTDADGNSPSKDVYLAADGRYEVLKVLDSIIRTNTVYSGSNSQDFTDAQTKFLDGRAAMMVNGSWLENEMGSSAKNKNIDMMKTPVISSIITRSQQIGDDEELSALIAAVDAAGTDKSAVAATGAGYAVTQDDVDMVYEARNLMYSLSDDNVILVPSYASAKGAALEFVKFFHSDEAITLFTDAANIPLNFDYSDGSGFKTDDWSAWSKNLYDMTRDVTPLLYNSFDKSPLFVSGGADPFCDVTPASAFNASAGRPTADSMWAGMESLINSQWTTYMRNAGLA